MTRIDRNRERAAYHEAGHAVAAYLFMLEIADLTLDGAQPVRPARAWDQDDASIESVESQILLALAGRAAVRRWAGAAVRCSHGEEEGALARRLSAEMQEASIGCADERLTAAHMRYLEEKARCLFESPGVWSAVEAVARALLERGSLAGEQVSQLLSVTGFGA